MFGHFSLGLKSMGTIETLKIPTTAISLVLIFNDYSST